MKVIKNILSSVLFVGTALVLFSFDLPKGWYKAGSEPKSYDMGTDMGAGHDGKNAATIKSTTKKIHGFGTLMQDSRPDKYLGRRIRMSGYMKSKDVDDKAGFWLRVDGTNPKESLSFDNMLDRPVKGTTDWKKYEIVLDVPLSSSNIAFGALLVGTGQIWFSNLNFETVDNTISATGRGIENYLPSPEPSNLNFEK
jgi:hypothetical protein